MWQSRSYSEQKSTQEMTVSPTFNASSRALYTNMYCSCTSTQLSHFITAFTCHTRLVQKVCSLTVSDNRCIPHFVTFQHSLLQLICTCSSISPKHGFCCRKTVVIGLPASHLPCIYHILIIGKFVSSQVQYSFSLGNKQKSLCAKSSSSSYLFSKNNKE